MASGVVSPDNPHGTVDPSDTPFLSKLASKWKARGWNPQHWLALTLNESGAEADPPHNNLARAMNQFTPGILAGLGWKDSPDAFAATIPAIDQLDYSERFYAPYQGANLNSIGKFYLATFLPALLVPGSRIPEQAKGIHDADPNVFLARKGVTTPVGGIPGALPEDTFTDADGKIHHGVYSANSGFDHEGKGYIALGDLENTVRRAILNQPQRWDAFALALSKLTGDPPLLSTFFLPTPVGSATPSGGSPVDGNEAMLGIAIAAFGAWLAWKLYKRA